MAEKLWSKLETTLIEKNKAFISVTGGGGKTSFLVSFSSYLKKRGYSVLITTSTKLASPYSFDYKTDRIFLSPSIMNYWPKKGESVFYGKFDDNLKNTVAPSSSLVSLLYDRYDVVIVEADGSRRLPFKVHTKRDPVIWRDTTAIVAISGLWGYGERRCDVVFEDHSERVVDFDYINELVNSPEGMRKGMGENTKNLLLFNGGDILERSVIEEIKRLFIPENTSSFIVSLNEDMIYESI